MAFQKLALALFLFLTAGPMAYASQPVTVNATSLNVRTASGAILCEVKNGTNLNAIARADSDWIKVKVSSPGCPAEGFVHSKYVKVKAAPAGAVVDADGLSFRNEPNLSEDSYECTLQDATQLIPSSEKPVKRGENTFIKVKLAKAVRGCPAEGWVSKSFVKMINGTADTGSLVALPQITRPTTAVPDDVSDCNGAGCARKNANPAIGQMNRVSDGIGTRIADEPPPRPPAPIPNHNNYLNALRTLIKNPAAKGTGLNTNRGLVQIPLMGRGNIAPCGSNHYLPDRPVGSDVYTNPLTACAFTNVLQEWRKICPERSGCTLQFGDISDRTDPRFRGNHATHTHGHCIDIRPLRKGGFEDSAITHGSRNYDRAATRRLVNLLKANGADTGRLYFNDTATGTRRMGGHDNHIHACFPSSPAVRAACSNLKVDPELCPEIP